MARNVIHTDQHWETKGVVVGRMGVMLPRYFLLQNFAQVNGANGANVFLYFTTVSKGMNLLVLIFILNPLIKNQLECSDFQFVQVQTV